MPRETETVIFSCKDASLWNAHCLGKKYKFHRLRIIWFGFDAIEHWQIFLFYGSLAKIDTRKAPENLRKKIDVPFNLIKMKRLQALSTRKSPIHAKLQRLYKTSLILRFYCQLCQFIICLYIDNHWKLCCSLFYSQFLIFYVQKVLFSTLMNTFMWLFTYNNTVLTFNTVHDYWKFKVIL